MFFPDRYPSGDWDTTRYAIAPQDVLFPSRDGTNLHGWLFRAATTPHAPLMVFFHGNAGNLTDRAPVSAELARRGISVLVFDWRGYGKSEGTPREERLYDDALAAYDFASKIEPSIAVYGESLGSPFAAWVAKHRRVRCAIIDSGFPSLMAMGNAHYFPLGYFAPRAMRTAAWLNDANVPVLVIHGKRDDVAPFALGQSLSDSLHGRKEMLVGETSGHCELESRAPQRYYETVTRFILESAR
jgi:pimeloyl-ACP methyl ester carboxylesterase